MRDFSLKCYTRFIHILKESDYKFQTFSDYLKTKESGKVIILRHDLDKRPESALAFALIEQKSGLKGSYYFRIHQNKTVTEIIKKIADLGHEIGYHYNDLAEYKGNNETAIASFERNLKLFRSICDIQTICMDGSPMSKWDNRELWKKYDYRNFGISGEPYFDLNTQDFFYLTDTGRSWDSKANRRDVMEMKNDRYGMLHYHSTFQILEAIENGSFPQRVMITFHPQRWTDNPFLWTKEMVWQGVKNQVKKYLFVK